MNEQQYKIWKDQMQNMIRAYCRSTDEFEYIVDFMCNIKGAREYQLLVDYHPNIHTEQEASDFLSMVSKPMFHCGESNPVAVSLNARLWIYLPMLRKKFVEEIMRNRQ